MPIHCLPAGRRFNLLCSVVFSKAQIGRTSWIANSIAHRSYLEPGDIQIALFDDRLEVTSPGMLLNGLPDPEFLDFDGDFRVNMFRKTTSGVNGINDTKNDTNDTIALSLIRENPSITQKEMKEKMVCFLYILKGKGEI